MKKEEFIKKHGEKAYLEKLKQDRGRKRKGKQNDTEGAKERKRLWRLNNPEKVKASNRKGSHEKNCGGKYYEHRLKYDSEGLRHDRNLIRVKHRDSYRSYKQIIAPDSQIHHEWIPESANFRGAALVEKDQHLHGVIDVIQILEGEITLFLETEIRRL